MIFGVSSCSDLQKESSNSACNTALDNQDFDTAISVCTSSKGKGDAYMGKGGFTVTNLLNNSGGETTPSHISGANTSNLGTVDSTGATIMYILGIAFSQVSDDTTRGTKIASAKSAFDSASSSYAGVIASDKDAALMYTFANVFAMQLGQSILYDAGDNGASSSTPSSCGTNYSNSETGIKNSSRHFSYSLNLNHDWSSSCSPPLLYSSVLKYGGLVNAQSISFISGHGKSSAPHL